MKIIINHDEHELNIDKISHEEICRLAGQPTWASVVYEGPRHGDSRRSGITCVGESIVVEEGMQISCIVTGNA